MAITYIPREPSLGERIGTGLGAGIGQGIANIAEHKLRQMEERRTKETRKEQFKRLGASDAEADFFVDQDPESQYYAMRDIILREHKGQENLINDWIPATPEEFKKVDQLREQNLERNASQQQALSPVSQALQRPGQMGLQESLQGIEKKLEQPSIGDRLQSFSQIAPEVKKRKDFEGINIRTPQERVLEPKLALERGKAAIKEQAQEKKFAHEEQKEINRRYEPYLQTLGDEAKAAKQSDLRLKRMEKLVDEGSLPIAEFYNQFKYMSEDFKSGIPGVGGLIDTAAGAIGKIGLSIQRNVTSRDMQEFEKLSRDFIKDAKNYFGARLTDNDLNQFMLTIPTLSNTDAGKKAIMRNMRIMNKAAELKEKAAQNIIKENRGRIPAELDRFVEERTSKQLDKLAEEFIDGVPKESISNVLINNILKTNSNPLARL